MQELLPPRAGAAFAEKTPSVLGVSLPSGFCLRVCQVGRQESGCPSLRTPHPAGLSCQKPLRCPEPVIMESRSCCSGLDGAPRPQRDAHSLISTGSFLLWKKGLCRCYKGFWDEEINWVGPKSTDQCQERRKPLKPRGRDQSEAKTLWPTDEKSQLIGKDPDAGKD